MPNPKVLETLKKLFDQKSPALFVSVAKGGARQTTHNKRTLQLIDGISLNNSRILLSNYYLHTHFTMIDPILERVYF